MAAANSLLKEQRKKLVDEGPISLAPDLLAKARLVHMPCLASLKDAHCP